jgi:hypothetical protein
MRPTVEIAKEARRLGVGCPLPVGDALCVSREPHGLVATRELLEAALVGVDGVAHCAVFGPAVSQVPSVLVQRAIQHAHAHAVGSDRRVLEVHETVWNVPGGKGGGGYVAWIYLCELKGRGVGTGGWEFRARG